MKKLILCVMVCFAFAQSENKALKNLELYSAMINQLKPAQINSLVLAIVVPMLPIKFDEQTSMDKLELIDGVLHGYLKLENVDFAKAKMHFENGAKTELCTDERFRNLLLKDMSFVGHFSSNARNSFALKVDRKFCEL